MGTTSIEQYRRTLSIKAFSTELSSEKYKSLGKMVTKEQ
jgi:hypothetical protein